MMFLGSFSWAQNDSIDVLNYDLTLDIDHNLSRTIVGKADLRMRLLAPCREISLDFQTGTIDSVLVNGANTPFSFIDNKITFASSMLSDSALVSIFYRTGGFVESYGFGGFHMGSAIHYNLGIAFEMWPPSMGRTWFPCRDNFYDKATFSLTVTCREGWRPICSGNRMSETVNDDLSTTSTWVLDKQTPTYLFSIAIAPFHVIERQLQSIYGIYPVTLGFTSHDSAAVAQAYQVIDYAVPMYERCFGPYRWDRIGYVSTPKGSMEHVNNIALVSVCMASMSQRCQSTICHELGHAWFGNLITCTYPSDMWINEGGASFTTEVAFEAAYGKDSSDRYYMEQLDNVIRTAHILDGGYYALHGIPANITYGSTTYDKGHLVWHSLRGYLGDSLFYSSLRTLFDRCAFGTLDAFAIRDSLSLYSGVDLTDFFDFHIFNPGFVDYVIDSLRVNGTTATIGLSQQLRGTTQYARSNRVPVTFFGPNNQEHTATLIFDSIATVQSIHLPFEATMALVDYHNEFSDAATFEQVSLAPTQSKSTSVNASFYSDQETDFVATQHWSAPQGSQPAEVERFATRFWTLSGTSLPTTGNFRFCRSGSANDTYIDQDFYDNAADFHRLALYYRRDAGHEWTFLTNNVKGGSENGYVRALNLQPGDYALAIIDTTMLSVNSINPQYKNFITPNPARNTISISVPTSGCTLRILNLSGAEVYSAANVPQTLNVSHLQPATYVAQLIDKNGNLIATQKIIIL